MSTSPPTAPSHDTAPGRPIEGPGSLGRLAPRAVALLIDWALCSIIAVALLHYRWGQGGAEGFKPLAVFAIENLFLVSTLGATIGHRIMGMQVQRNAGGPPGFFAGGVRTLLLCLAIPPMVTDQYGRGMHDKTAGTLIVRTR